MRKIFLLFFLHSITTSIAQEKETIYKNTNNLQLDYIYTNIVAKNGVEHLTTNTTKGFLISWNKETYGSKKWQQRFNYPDVGLSFGYTNFNNSVLGELLAIYGHYNFYFFNKQSKNNLVLGLGAGFAYATNPYDKITNNKNIALGSHLNTSNYLKLFYQRENIIDRLSFHAGFMFTHASNGSLKSPNKGINFLGIHTGITYDLDPLNSSKKYLSENNNHTLLKEKYHFNMYIVGGGNEADHIDTGLYPFLSFATYLDKQYKNKYAFQFGLEYHLHYYLKEQIKFSRIFSGDVTNTDSQDWKRLSIFAGYELLLNKSSIFAQFGYYIYNPFDENGAVYEKLGIKRYLNKSLFATISVKAHGFNAEALEFGIGYRF